MGFYLLLTVPHFSIYYYTVVVLDQSTLLEFWKMEYRLSRRRLVFFSPFSIAITSLGEERANLSAFRTFVRFVFV